MIPEEFQKVLDSQLESIRVLLARKTQEYGGPDQFRNIKASAALQGVSPKEAVGGAMAKHIVSLYHMIGHHTIDLEGDDVSYALDTWEEKITDTIIWLILLYGLVVEEADIDVNELAIPETLTVQEAVATLRRMAKAGVKLNGPPKL